MITQQKPDHATLEISGVRQAGKTYIVNRFADEQSQKRLVILTLV